MRARSVVLGLALLCLSSAAARAQWGSMSATSPSYDRMNLRAIAAENGAANESWLAVGQRWPYGNIGVRIAYWVWGSNVDYTLGGPSNTMFSYSFSDVVPNSAGPHTFSFVGSANPNADGETLPTGVLYDSYVPTLNHPAPIELMAGFSTPAVRVVSDSAGYRYVALTPSTNSLVVLCLPPPTTTQPPYPQPLWTRTLTGLNTTGVMNGFQLADMAVDSSGLYVLTTSANSSGAWGALLFRLNTGSGSTAWQSWFTENLDAGSVVKAYQVRPDGSGGALLTATNVANDVGDGYMITTSVSSSGALTGWVRREFAVRSTPPSVPPQPMSVIPKGLWKDGTDVFVVADRLDQGGTSKIDMLKYAGSTTTQLLYNNPASNAVAGGIRSSNGTVLVLGLSGNPGSALFLKLSAATLQPLTANLTLGSGMTDLAATTFRFRADGSLEGYVLALGKDANLMQHYYVHAAY